LSARNRLIEPDDVCDSLESENSAFLLDAAVGVAANDRAGFRRLLRYGARLLNVRPVASCCRWQLEARCPFLAEPSPAHVCLELYCGHWHRESIDSSRPIAAS
jgi:hypothetical protein